MENKKTLIHIILGLYLVSLILGVFLIIRSAPKEKEVKRRAMDFKLKQEGVAVIYIYGPISVAQQESPMPFWGFGSDRVVERIERARKDPRVKAVVLRINSPGGSVGSVQEIYQEIEKLKKDGKKVVASMGDVAASGGYYVACIADKIMANPGTVTGSIGVIASLGNIEELFKKIGVKIEVIKSGKHKDIGSSTRPMTPEERRILQNLINNAYEQFLQAIVKGRNMPYEEVKQLADGSICTGQQAKENGLIDELGNLQEAIKLAGQLAGIKGEPEIIKDYTPFERFFGIFGQQFEENALNKILNKQGIRLEYMLE